MAKVFLAGIKKGSSEQLIGEAVRASVEAVTDFSWLSKGDSVFIKPALNSGHPYPSTTSPIGIVTMVQLLKDNGAGWVVLGDMSGIEHVKLSPGGVSGSTRMLMEKCGMAKAALEAGAELHFFEEAGYGAGYRPVHPTPPHHWGSTPVYITKIYPSSGHKRLNPAWVGSPPHRAHPRHP